MTEKFLKNVNLSQHTTIGLGGAAKLFISCKDTDELLSALDYAGQNKLPVQVFSGGSNIIFPEEGFDGLVIKIDLRGIESQEKGNIVFVKVKAGEIWDDVVKYTIEKSLTGTECLSGIPGSAGATPVQNVGAYGQEIKDTFVSLKAIDRKTLMEVKIDYECCGFGYRQSRFKKEDKDRFVITEILLGFIKDKQPVIKYPELQKYIETKINIKGEDPLKIKLNAIRDAVLNLRKSKSMLIDINDPNSRSCGSFFMNPMISKEEVDKFYSLVNGNIDINKEQIPVYRSGDKYKLSAAWLVEKAGFKKGYIKGGVGISENHSLALVNINGTTDELMDLAGDIKETVHEKFGIYLNIEPVLI
jgi:UDP-N-acetylmuramate dehydrogenase